MLNFVCATQKKMHISGKSVRVLSMYYNSTRSRCWRLLQCKVINGSMRNAYEQSEQVPEIIII